MTNIDKLIADLAAKAGNRTKPIAPVILFAGWLSALALYVVIIFASGLMKFRPDLIQVMMTPLFMGEMVGLFALVSTSCLAAALVSYPDRGKEEEWRVMTISAVLFFVFELGREYALSGPSVLPAHPDMSCLSCIIGLAFLPACLIFWRMHTMATVKPGVAGMLCTLCAFSLGALILRLSEQTDDMPHIITVHYMPMLIFCALGFGLGARFLKW